MPATASKPLREQLKHVEANIDELRDKRAAAADEQKAAQTAYAGLEDLKPGSPEFEAAKEATRKVGNIDEEIASWQSEQVEILKMLGQSPEQIRRDNGVQDGVMQRQGAGWSADAVLTESIQEQLAQFAGSQAKIGTLRLGEVISREDFAADIAPTTNMRRGNYFGVIPQLQRPLTLLDLIPVSQMDGKTVPFTVESGSFSGAAETDEGGIKPEAGVTYTDDEATARGVPAWMKIHKDALSDVPLLRGIIEQRLRYIVLRRLESQILNGSGTTPNIRGILNTSGIGAVAYNGAELISDQILSGMTNVLLADAMADAVVLHPTDWTTVLKSKAADGHYYSGGPFSMTPMAIWGVPLLASQAIPVGHALVGDFSIGTQLFIREGVKVLFSDSDGDDFIKNRVTLLGEMRAALATWRPAAFVDVDIAP